jgi:hypothetical protein
MDRIKTRRARGAGVTVCVAVGEGVSVAVCVSVSASVGIRVSVNRIVVGRRGRLAGFVVWQAKRTEIESTDHKIL